MAKKTPSPKPGKKTLKSVQRDSRVASPATNGKAACKTARQSVQTATRKSGAAPLKKTVTAKLNIENGARIKKAPKIVTKTTSKKATPTKKAVTSKNKVTKVVENKNVAIKKSSSIINGTVLPSKAYPQKQSVRASVKEAVMAKKIKSTFESSHSAAKISSKSSQEDLREFLLNRRSELLKNIGEEVSSQEEEKLTGTAGDMADIAQDSTENELVFRLAEVESRELEQIDMALSKIGEGSYGVCEICSESISSARLKALPFASKCIRCQEAEDAGRDAGGYWGGSYNSTTDNSTDDSM